MLHLDLDQYLELEKIGIGAFAPLTGFMDEDDFWSCVRSGRLKNGSVFTIPIVLDISAEDHARIRTKTSIDLLYDGVLVGRLRPSSIFKPDRREATRLIFGTDDSEHPGVAHFCGLGEYFIGGEIELLERVSLPFTAYERTPSETKQYFAQMGWKTIVGFQTRNAPHRAHEYLQKAALELCDGILIQPLVGRKKPGDFNPTAVLTGYDALIQHYYPATRVLLAVLSTVMRYAGPREAVFHAIVRRNYGCTHFIVGRDHAGVGSYYDKYAAHKYVETFDASELGITVLRMRGPYLCLKCDSITTDKTCPHGDSHPQYTRQISGTYIRQMLADDVAIDERVIRPEVVEAVRLLPSPFIS
ncbi:MAG: sulfate adenylyltransferase [Deltaproteobacteria bacterium]|nr:sulfate adenylyltransferase [Deltaproteobacteria bacterium]